MQTRMKAWAAALFATTAVGLAAPAYAGDKDKKDKSEKREEFRQKREEFREKLKDAREERRDKRQVITYADVIRVRNNGAQGELAPQVRITSPLNGGFVTRGEGFEGAGSVNGSGFALNLEIFTRDAVGVRLDEATQDPGRPGIRHAELVGERNQDFPGLFVFVDIDLIKPDGGIIPKNTNLANLFNVAGTDDTPGKGVTAWIGWHVLESLPNDVESFKITAAVVDDAGRIGFDEIEVDVTADGASGNALTPDPSTYRFNGVGEIDVVDGPKVEIVAPRVPSSIAVGDQVLLPTGQTGSLNFIQVNILDLAGAGIAVDEVGETVTAPEFGPGVILDPAQLGNGDNRNFPGLHFSFDAPLQAPTGVFVPAGGNLAPVFNVVGSEIDPLTGAVRVVADWVVGGSLILEDGQEFVTFKAVVTDNDGKAGVSERRFRVSEVLGGQLLTPAP